MPLSSFHPLVQRWFAARFGQPTEPQVEGWPAIREGHDVLISAPTGSGKTLAAFLFALDRLAREGNERELEEKVDILYVSPLKALSNDVAKNLDGPLSELAELAARSGEPWPEIRTAVRTGDTRPSERQRMRLHPPPILVTTPESLFILLTSESGRAALQSVRTVIVDEVHAVASNKRGSHLALSLARLDDLVERNGGERPQRVALSATVSPIEEVSRFIGATDRCVEIGHRRETELRIEVPGDELGAVATHEMWSEIYDKLADHIRRQRTTLVFVGTRKLAERIAHNLRGRLGDEAVLAHHGSLARELRLYAEQELKAGRLKAVVATASLELGIDIGSVDLACQVGSPRSITVALQRVGRSGHWVGAISKGVFFPTTRDELVETAALVRAMRGGELDRVSIPKAPLDVLAQQIVAMVACDDWSEDELFELARSTHSYRGLKRDDFDAVIEMLSEGIATSRGRSRTYLHRDQVNGLVRGRRGARLAAITSGGTIPDLGQYQVVAEPEGKVVGTLDEDFVVESNGGDIFLLGTTSWRIRRVEPGRVRVEDAHGAAPTIPFWRGEAPGRSFELSREVARLRADVAERSDRDREATLVFLAEEAAVERRGAEQLVAYVRAGRAALGALPTQQTVVAERFFDESGGMQLVIHSPFGARINRAWGLALRKRFCRSFNLELQAAATDDGVLISLSDQHAFPLELVFSFVRTATLEDVLRQAVLTTPIFTARWRWNASCSLAVLRFQGGRKVPAPLQRMRAEDLLAAVFPDQAACAENLSGEVRIPDHPLTKQVLDDCLTGACDVAGLRKLLDGIESGEVATVAIDTAEPSPFCHEILNSNPFAFLDDAPLEERRARAVQMRRTLPEDIADGPGALDETAIARVESECWPVVRDADELHDALLTLVTLPEPAEWTAYFEELVSTRRATVMIAGETRLWVAAERLELARLLHGEASLEPAIPAAGSTDVSSEEAAAAGVVRGWLESTGPRTVSELSETLRLRPALVEQALAQLESEGQVLRGAYRPGAREGGGVEWCNRRLLARIHRLTLGRLRREIEPVSAADFMRFLVRWQRAVPGTRLHGLDGCLKVVEQLQGYELPAAAWEEDVLPARVSRYRRELLDQLCLSGEVAWGRLSRHPALEERDEEDGPARRVRASRIAPPTLVLREELDWLLQLGRPGEAQPLDRLSANARQVLSALEAHGAAFFPDLRRATGRLPAELEDALWELLAAGLVTSDGYDNLRAVLDPKRRRGESGRLRPRQAAGRWALLRASVSSERGDCHELLARQLLTRWGIVFRDLVVREPLIPAWREMLIALRRLEDRGEVRGGRFVSGFMGEQFALPEAVALLRSVRRSEKTGEEVEVAAADPLNLLGIILPGPRLSPLSSSRVTIRDGVAEVVRVGLAAGA